MPQTIRQYRALHAYVWRIVPTPAGCFWLPYVAAVVLIALWLLA